MKLHLTPTDQIVRVDGRDCRIWTGTGPGGIPVKAAIAFVQPQTDDPGLLSSFEAALTELPPASQALIVDFRFVL